MPQPVTNKHHLVVFSIGLLIFCASVFAQFYQPMRDMGVARSGVPFYASIVGFIIAITAFTIPHLKQKASMIRALLPMLGAGLLLGVIAWCIEHFVYFNAWKTGLSWRYLIAAALGGFALWSLIGLVKITLSVLPALPVQSNKPCRNP